MDIAKWWEDETKKQSEQQADDPKSLAKTQTTSDKKDDSNKKDPPKPPKKKRQYERIKLVRVKLKPDRKKMDQRKCLSEHSFGTIKRAMGATYFLLKGKAKTTGEFALLSMGYNLARAENLLGFSVLMQKVKG